MTDPNPNYTQSLNNYYGQTADLTTVILDAIRAAGKDPTHLNYTDLPAIDQFHSKGPVATAELAQLAQLANLQPTDTVLDVGGGLGGPARQIAAEIGCHVTVLDLTEAFVTAGRNLTDLTNLSSLVTFRLGNALAMPFPDASFSAAYTQHSSMNIPDKPTLYAEIYRVLKPGAIFALHEVMAVSADQPLHYPLPWASTPDISFVLPASEMRDIIASAGFRELSWQDTTAATLQWLRDRQTPTNTPTSGIHLLIGPRTNEAFATLSQNHRENRTCVIMAAFQKP